MPLRYAYNFTLSIDREVNKRHIRGVIVTQMNRSGEKNAVRQLTVGALARRRVNAVACMRAQT